MATFGKAYHWTDTSRAARVARDRLRDDFKRGWKRPAARGPEVARTDAEIAALASEAERHPSEFFKCRVCGSGPWHITWGGFCPGCSGAD